MRLAKRLKKNNIAVDIVNFGEQEENTQKLEAFIAAVNSNSNSHLVTVPPGPHILSDILISTPIVTGEEAAGSTSTSEGGAASSGGHEFGFDPNLDPELALVILLSCLQSFVMTILSLIIHMNCIHVVLNHSLN